MKPFAYGSFEISMVLESPGSCCEAMIDGLESPGSCYEAVCTLFEGKILMVLESPGSCCKSIIDGLESRGVTMGIDVNRLLDFSMLAAGLSLVLVAGLCLVNSAGRFACWFKKVAGFDALSGV